MWNVKRKKPDEGSNGVINFILWSFFMTTFGSGIVVGYMMTHSGAEFTAMVITIFVSIILAIIANSRKNRD